MRLWKIAGYQWPAAKKDLDTMRPFLFFKISKNKVKHRTFPVRAFQETLRQNRTPTGPYFPSIPGVAWCSARAGGGSQGEKVWAEGERI